MHLSRSIALFACAVFVPSSLGAGPNLNLQWALSLLAMTAVLVFVPSRREPYNGGSVAIVALFGMTALVSTVAGVLSGAGRPSPTSIAPFLIALLMTVAFHSTSRSSDISFGQPAALRLELIAWPLVALGLLQTLDVDVAWKFTTLLYNASYSDLLGNMRIGGEPVTVFATHSVAAVAYAVLALCCLALLGDPQLSRVRRASMRLVIVGLLILLARLLGSTALVFTLVTIGAVMFVGAIRATEGLAALRARVLLSLAALGAVGLVGGIVLFIREQEATPWGGVAARLNSSGPYAVVPSMGRNLVFGTGFFERADYSYADSGALETLARFGIVGAGLLVILYVWLALDVRNVLSDGRFVAERWVLVFAVAALGVFEFGYEVLTSPRLLPLLLAVPQFGGEYAQSVTQSLRQRMAHEPGPDNAGSVKTTAQTAPVDS